MYKWRNGSSIQRNDDFIAAGTSAGISFELSSTLGSTWPRRSTTTTPSSANFTSSTLSLSSILNWTVMKGICGSRCLLPQRYTTVAAMALQTSSTPTVRGISDCKVGCRRSTNELKRRERERSQSCYRRRYSSKWYWVVCLCVGMGMNSPEFAIYIPCWNV